MSAINEVLNQFLAEGASGDWFARCDDARREIDNLRAENDAMRKALRIIVESIDALRCEETACTADQVRFNDGIELARTALARKETT